MRKTRLMWELEQRHGKPITEIVRQAAEEHFTPNEAAMALGVSRGTFMLWCAAFKIETENRRIAFFGSREGIPA